MLTDDETVELARLEAAFEEAGGRGVELAERIDWLRLKRDDVQRFVAVYNPSAYDLFTAWQYGAEGAIRIFGHLDPMEWGQGEPAYSPETQEFICACQAWVAQQEEEGE